MQDIVRSLANIEHSLLDIGTKVETLRSQIRNLTENAKQKNNSSLTSSYQTEPPSTPVAAGKPQRKTPYGSPYRQDGWGPRTAVSSTQEGIQESWVVGDGNHTISTTTMIHPSYQKEAQGYHPSPQAYARQSEYSIYARP